jgi:hypothetical protein
MGPSLNLPYYRYPNLSGRIIHAAMETLLASFYIHLFVFACEKCGNPVITWAVYPQGTPIEAQESMLHQRCTNCQTEMHKARSEAAVSAQFVLVGNKGYVTNTRSNSDNDPVGS